MKKGWLIGCLLLGGSLVAEACHQGGGMGFARKKPGHFLIDLSSSPTFIFASTSGTSGCENWDVDSDRKNPRYWAAEYIHKNWKSLEEEASRGEGPHLAAFYQMLECPQGAVMDLHMFQKNYTHLFYRPRPRNWKTLNPFLNDAKQAVCH